MIASDTAALGVAMADLYPQVSIETTSFGHVDSRLSYGHVTSPGIYTTTITRPQLFRHYLKEQLALLMRNHQVPITVSESTTRSCMPGTTFPHERNNFFFGPSRS